MSSGQRSPRQAPNEFGAPEDTAPDLPETSVSGSVPSSYRVRLDLFEGPLDLLLHLIKKNEVDVADIPIARITEQYLSYLDLMHELNLEVAGEFLVMAATLTLIKSRMLLPASEADEEEEADPRSNLVRQLLEYQRFREAARALEERPRLYRDVFPRPAGADDVDPQAEPGPPRVRASLWDLLEAFRAVLNRARPDSMRVVETEEVTLRHCLDRILRILSVARSTTFDSLFDDGASRARILVTFLALLELVKLGAVAAVQEETFGPIMVVLTVDDVSSVRLGLVDDYGDVRGAGMETPQQKPEAGS